MLNTSFVTDNRLVNGDFLIDQANEFTEATPSVSANIGDTYSFETTGLGSNFTFQIQPTISPADCLNTLKVTNITTITPTATQYATLDFPIEGINVNDMAFGTNSARGFTVSFRARTSGATGYYYLSIRNSASTRSYVTPIYLNGANVFIPFSIFIPGDVTGTWLNTIGTRGMVVGFDLGSGTNFQSTANTWSAGNFTSASNGTSLSKTAGAILYISNLIVSPGPLLNLAYSPRAYSIELNLCRRLYQKTFPSGTVPAQSAGVAGAITVKNPIAAGEPSYWWQFTQQMAKTPAITTYNPSVANANWRDITTSSDITVSVDPATTIGTNGVLLATSVTVATLGDILSIHAVADARI